MAVFDFRQQQERSRRHSLLLVALFVAMVLVISTVVGVLAVVFIETGEPEAGFDVWMAAAFAGATMAVVFGAALFKSISLSGEGARVAQALGAEEVTEDTRNPAKKRYFNVVEEMAIAAGLPRPRVFVIKHENGINAFAAGSTPQNAAVGVTHGALALLNREELAGVVAHEMAHIANLDTHLNTRLMAMVFGLVVLYTLGRVALRSSYLRPRRRNNKGGVPAVLAIGLGLILLGSLGVFFGRLLQSAVSRRREYLADATGVQFTRNPMGLANALKKIGAAQAGSRLGNAHAEEARHMFFAAATGSIGNLLSTHPPLFERIRALDPHFDPAIDPIMAMDERTFMREARAEFAGPWSERGFQS